MRRTTGRSQPGRDIAIEKDGEIRLRDGVALRADVFRPKRGGRFPALVNLGSYQKDKLSRWPRKRALHAPTVRITTSARTSLTPAAQMSSHLLLPVIPQS